MSILAIAALTLLMVGTAFLSGVFGMAGGMVLVGVLLAVMPLPAAMAIHAVTQMASNLWRAFLWRKHVRFSAAWPFLAGSVAAMGAWSLTGYVPDKPVALLMLGLTPFMARALPKSLHPDPASIRQGIVYGGIAMTLMLLTGVSGPLVDTFFLGSGRLERRQIVATKAACQVVGHLAKFIYFGAVIDQAAGIDPLLAVCAIGASMLGTSLGRYLLEAMSDAQYRVWANRIITTVCTVYIAQGAWLLLR